MGAFAFKILGALELEHNGGLVPVRAGREQLVLAMLLLEAGHVVPLARLVEAVWDADPPQAAEKAVRNTVSGLRSRLAHAGGPQTLIDTNTAGYRLRLDRSQLDATRFADHAASARHLAGTGRAEEAVSEFRAALELWRGPALAGLSGWVIEAAAARLEEQRLTAWEECLDLELRLGRHRDVTDELRVLVSEHPLRERMAGQLMLALYRAGRQAEALDADDLGLDPSGEITRLHEAILRHDPTLDPEGEPQRDIPRELPPTVPGFTGRSAELAALTGLLDQSSGSTAPTIVISAIGGTAGVGKTALAVQWAHQAADRFPDGQLYVNLRGYDPDQPMPPAGALAGFLRALGVPGQDIPPGEDERAARYRSLLAGKKMLIVLDNAGSAEQARPLLPGNPGCAVLVTSRDTLAGLVARHGATRVELDLLPLPDAAGLLRELIGQRVKDDPGAAGTLAGQCSRLPLALRVAAELAATRSDVPLAGLVAELADQQRRLDLLDAGGDPRTAVRAVFSWSYRHLNPDAARAFRLAGLQPGADFDPYAAAALTGMTIERARTVLDALARAHVIQSARPGRYGMHDLLRAYARELAAQDGEDEQAAALTRLFDHYLHTAATAMDALYPAESHRRPRIPPPATPTPQVTESAAALKWLDAECPTLVAVSVHAAGHGWPSHATRLSDTLFRYLDEGGHYPEAVTIHSHARAAAERTGDRAAEATALNYLGATHTMQGRFQEAVGHLRQALALFEQVGDLRWQARAVDNLGAIHHHLGRYREAIGLYRQALTIKRDTGDLVGEAITLNNLGISEERLGRYHLAARHCRRVLAIAAKTGARNVEALALDTLGTVVLRQGHYQQAAGYLHKALALSREIGYREIEADALARTGDLCLRQGQPGEAATHLREALALYRETGFRSGEADAQNSLGAVMLATGQPDHARAEYVAALALAVQTGDKYQQARAHSGLGQAYRAGGDTSRARRHSQQAFALFTELGTPEASEIRAHLATAADNGHDDHKPARHDDATTAPATG